MTSITIKIQNLDKIQNKFYTMPVKITKGLDTAVSKTLILVDRNAKVEAPVNKQSGGGNLRQSIMSKKTGIAKGQVSVGVNYAVFVHEGTRPHEINALVKRVLANKRTGQIFGKKVKHPGTKANPFLQRAVDNSEKDINDYFNKILGDIIKE